MNHKHKLQLLQALQWGQITHEEFTEVIQSGDEIIVNMNLAGKLLNEEQQEQCRHEIECSKYRHPLLGEEYFVTLDLTN